MQGPSVKLLPNPAGLLECLPNEELDKLAIEGHIKEENEAGWVIAECGTFVPKSCYHETAREWDSEESENTDED